MELDELGNRIKLERQNLGLSQEQLAKEIGSRQGDVSKIEKGELIGKYLFAYLRFLKKKGIDLNKLF